MIEPKVKPRFHNTHLIAACHVPPGLDRGLTTLMAPDMCRVCEEVTLLGEKGRLMRPSEAFGLPESGIMAHFWKGGCLEAFLKEDNSQKPEEENSLELAVLTEAWGGKSLTGVEVKGTIHRVLTKRCRQHCLDVTVKVRGRIVRFELCRGVMTVIEHWAWTPEMSWIVITRTISCHWVASTMVITLPLVSLRNQNVSVILMSQRNGAGWQETCLEPSGRFKPKSVLLQGLSLLPHWNSLLSCSTKLSIVSKSCVHKYILQNCNNKASTVLSESSNRYRKGPLYLSLCFSPLRADGVRWSCDLQGFVEVPG